MTLMLASSSGQTFFIALFGGELRTAFGLSDGAFGAAYAAATLAAAILFARIGREMDRYRLPAFTAAAGGTLAAGCLFIAWSEVTAVLVFGLLLVRLGGQGLLVHVAMVTVARADPTSRGRSLAFAALGLAIGEAVLPVLAVLGMRILGWRTTWVLCAVGTLAFIAIALWLLPGRTPEPLRRGGGGRPIRDPALWRDPAFLRAVPALLSTSFLMTGFFFHQARLAEQKGWDLGWIAASFVGYAALRALVLLLSGSLIDRAGSTRILPWALVPLAVSLAAIVFGGSHPSVVVLYLAAIGVSASLSGLLATSLWTELYPARRLAEARATVGAASVVASGLSPIAFGLALDAGVDLVTVAAVGVVVVALSAVIAWPLRSVERDRAADESGQSR